MAMAKRHHGLEDGNGAHVSYNAMRVKGFKFKVGDVVAVDMGESVEYCFITRFYGRRSRSKPKKIHKRVRGVALYNARDHLQVDWRKVHLPSDNLEVSRSEVFLASYHVDLPANRIQMVASLSLPNQFTCIREACTASPHTIKHITCRYFCHSDGKGTLWVQSLEQSQMKQLMSPFLAPSPGHDRKRRHSATASRVRESPPTQMPKHRISAPRDPSVLSPTKSRSAPAAATPLTSTKARLKHEVKASKRKARSREDQLRDENKKHKVHQESSSSMLCSTRKQPPSPIDPNRTTTLPALFRRSASPEAPAPSPLKVLKSKASSKPKVEMSLTAGVQKPSTAASGVQKPSKSKAKAHQLATTSGAQPLHTEESTLKMHHLQARKVNHATKNSNPKHHSKREPSSVAMSMATAGNGAKSTDAQSKNTKPKVHPKATPLKSRESAVHTTTRQPSASKEAVLSSGARGDAGVTTKPDDAVLHGGSVSTVASASAAPIDAPHAAPIEAPHAHPIEAPHAHPIEAPHAHPTEAPHVAPIEAPHANAADPPQDLKSYVPASREHQSAFGTPPSGHVASQKSDKKRKLSKPGKSKLYAVRKLVRIAACALELRSASQGADPAPQEVNSALSQVSVKSEPQEDGPLVSTQQISAREEHDKGATTSPEHQNPKIVANDRVSISNEADVTIGPSWCSQYLTVYISGSGRIRSGLKLGYVKGCFTLVSLGTVPIERWKDYKGGKLVKVNNCSRQSEMYRIVSRREPVHHAVFAKPTSKQTLRQRPTPRPQRRDRGPVQESSKKSGGSSNDEFSRSPSPGVVSEPSGSRIERNPSIVPAAGNPTSALAPYREVVESNPIEEQQSERARRPVQVLGNSATPGRLGDKTVPRQNPTRVSKNVVGLAPPENQNRLPNGAATNGSFGGGSVSVTPQTVDQATGTDSTTLFPPTNEGDPLAAGPSVVVPWIRASVTLPPPTHDDSDLVVASRVRDNEENVPGTEEKLCGNDRLLNDNNTKEVFSAADGVNQLKKCLPKHVVVAGVVPSARPGAQRREHKHPPSQQRVGMPKVSQPHHEAQREPRNHTPLGEHRAQLADGHAQPNMAPPTAVPNNQVQAGWSAPDKASGNVETSQETTGNAVQGDMPPRKTPSGAEPAGSPVRRSSRGRVLKKPVKFVELVEDGNLKSWVEKGQVTPMRRRPPMRDSRRLGRASPSRNRDSGNADRGTNRQRRNKELPTADATDRIVATEPVAPSIGPNHQATLPALRRKPQRPPDVQIGSKVKVVVQPKGGSLAVGAIVMVELDKIPRPSVSLSGNNSGAGGVCFARVCDAVDSDSRLVLIQPLDRQGQEQAARLLVPKRAIHKTGRIKTTCPQGKDEETVGRVLSEWSPEKRRELWVLVNGPVEQRASRRRPGGGKEFLQHSKVLSKPPPRVMEYYSLQKQFYPFSNNQRIRTRDTAVLDRLRRLCTLDVDDNSKDYTEMHLMHRLLDMSGTRERNVVNELVRTAKLRVGGVITQGQFRFAMEELVPNGQDAGGQHH